MSKTSLTSDWLKKKIAELELARDEIPFGLDSDESKTLLALKQALVSMEAKPVAIVDVQHGRADANMFACTFTRAGHALKDDVYMLFAGTSTAGGPAGQSPVYQMRMLDNSTEAEQWVEVSEQEFHTPLKDPSLWDKRILYASPYAEPPAPDTAFLDEARMCAFVLEQIGGIEADDLDSDSVDLRFELNGVDTGSDVSITDYAARAANVISRLLSVLPSHKSDHVTFNSSALAFAYRELTPQLMRNHLFVFERYGLIPKDESTVIQALRIALDGMTRRGGNRPGELHPGIAEFYIAEQNTAGKFELSEDCMCAIASLLDGGFTLPDSLRERCEQIVAGQFSYKLQELAHLVLTTSNASKSGSKQGGDNEVDERTSIDITVCERKCNAKAHSVGVK